MFNVFVYNKIAQVGLDELDSNLYRIHTSESDQGDPDVILLRSHLLSEYAVPASVKAVARAGAGVNNIPVSELTKRGIPVFNTPGANANAVKELVVSAMLLGSRNICQGWQFTRQLTTDDGVDINREVEQNKKQFIGFELAGRTLGVVGLGAIGVKVANTALALGMNVLGFDPQITVQRAWELSAQVVQADNIEQLMEHSDVVTVHVPLIEPTRNLINADRLKLMPEGAMLINFARHGIVDDTAVKAALNNANLHAYVTDFPSKELLGQERVIALPHLGASTYEAEENCAVMAAREIRQFLEQGTITHSVNFPEAHMARGSEHRIAVVNANVPNMVAQISGVLGRHNLNIVDLLNRSRETIAYTLIDVDQEVSDDALDELNNIQGVLSVRKL